MPSPDLYSGTRYEVVFEHFTGGFKVAGKGIYRIKNKRTGVRTGVYFDVGAANLDCKIRDANHRQRKIGYE